MKISKYLSLFGVMVAVSCSNDFMDTQPQSSISEDNFFKSESDLQLYVNGIHSLPGYGLYLSDQGTDDMATTGAVEVKNVIYGSPNADNITSGWSWDRLRNINFLLENVDNADLDQSALNHFEGVGKYYRAEFYYGKVKRYSDVPWYSNTLSSTDEDLYKARDNRSLVVDSIMADISYAAAHIREDVAYGNIDKWAALAMKARIALHEGTFRKYHGELSLGQSANTYLEMAAEAAKEVINSGNFQIYNTGTPTSDYRTLFNSEDLSGNPEVILVNVYDADKNKNSGNYTVFGNYEQSVTKSLISSYLMANGTRFNEVAGSDEFTFVEEFQNRDPRLMQSFAYPGWVEAGSSNPYIQVLNKNFTGYHQLKGLNNTVSNAGVDIAVMRYAEILLIYAEAKAELGTITQADLDMSVNLLRSRAGLPAMILLEANADIDPELEAYFPNVDGSDKGVILEIRRERRVEFAAEGKRYDDLMRWAAGKVLEINPVGMYFPSLGKYDMTGDGVEDIHIIGSSESIPSPKEQNGLGVDLIYYKAGVFGDDQANLYLSDGTSGYMVTTTDVATFEDPKYYYRPVPSHQVALNPNLTQIMGW